jgi:hypothetical protein
VGGRVCAQATVSDSVLTWVVQCAHLVAEVSGGRSQLWGSWSAARWRQSERTVEPCPTTADHEHVSGSAPNHNQGETTVDDDADQPSDHHANNHPGNDLGNDAEYGSVPFDRMPRPRPVPDNDGEHLPDTIFGEAEWWYYQRAQGKRGKDRRYTGRVQRIGGSAGEKIRAELAATIRDLLEWAKQQQDDAAERESSTDGRADEHPH